MGSKNTLFGIGKNWIIASFSGIIVGLFLIFVSRISPVIGVIGIPYFPSAIAGTIGRVILIVFSAPIFETLFFQGIVQDLIQSKLKLGWVIGAIGSSLLFMVFHLTAYGGQFAGVTGSFITVFVAGIIFAGVRKVTKSSIATIFCHAVINLSIFITLVVVVA